MAVVWVVTKRHPNLSLVDNSSKVYSYSVEEIVGIYGSEEKAREVQETLINFYIGLAAENGRCVESGTETWISEYEIQ